MSRQLEVPVDTVRNWRRGRLPRAARLLLDGVRCDRCGHPHEPFAIDPASYVYALGMYLGDGCLGRQPRTWSLRVSLDNAYPQIIEECRSAVARVSPSGVATVCPSYGSDCSVVWAYSKHWPCLLPQHGPGKKHERPIVLDAWQQALVDQSPWMLLRALIHSDGWRGMNRVQAKGKDYAYPRYQFSNRSGDIRRMFTDTCDTVGVAWRPWGRWHISVARREAVALLDEHVGLKR